jgi:hypothetical protein
MASRLDDIHAADFAPSRGTQEVWEDVIRRVGGQVDHEETVEAIVELDSLVASDRGGLITDTKGDRIDFDARIDIAADQETTMEDRWVIRGEAYDQLGEAIGKDGATQTIVLMRRKGRRSREPRFNAR